MNNKLSIAQLVRLGRKELVNYFIDFYHTKTLESLSEVSNILKKIDKESNSKIDLKAIEIAFLDFSIEIKKHIKEEEEEVFSKISDFENLSTEESKNLNDYILEIEEDSKNIENILELLKILTENFKIYEEYTILNRELVIKLEELYLISREHLDGENIVLFSRVR